MYVCTNPIIAGPITKDPVDGSPKQEHVRCVFARKADGSCGVEAKGFEPWTINGKISRRKRKKSRLLDAIQDFFT